LLQASAIKQASTQASEYASMGASKSARINSTQDAAERMANSDDCHASKRTG